MRNPILLSEAKEHELPFAVGRVTSECERHKEILDAIETKDAESLQEHIRAAIGDILGVVLVEKSDSLNEEEWLELREIAHGSTDVVSAAAMCLALRDLSPEFSSDTTDARDLSEDIDSSLDRNIGGPIDCLLRNNGSVLSLDWPSTFFNNQIVIVDDEAMFHCAPKGTESSFWHTDGEPYDKDRFTVFAVGGRDEPKYLFTTEL